MTVPSGDFAFDQAGTYQEDNIEDVFPVKVHVTGMPPAERALIADLSSWQTFLIKAGQPLQQILLRNPRRSRAIVSVNPGITKALTAFTGSGSATNPGATTQITATPVLPAGWYHVTVNVNLSGTVTSADGNNMFAGGSGTPAFPISYPGVVNGSGSVAFDSFYNGTGVAAVFNNLAASGPSAVYNASISAVAIEQPYSDGVIVGSPAQCSQSIQPQSGPGGFLAIGTTVVIEDQKDLYAVLPTPNSGPVLITVLDETFSEIIPESRL